MTTIRAAMVAAANLMLRCATVAGIHVESYVYYENWRRPTGCNCMGCKMWQHVMNGHTTVDAVGQRAVECRNRFLEWQDKVLVWSGWDMGAATIWILAALGVGLMFHYPMWSVGVFAIVTTVGKNDILTQYFKGSAYTATWYLGLVDGGTTPTYVVGDTMASHAGWTENVGYSNANRVTWTGGTAAAGSIDNTASVAAFNMNATGTIAGQFMVNQSTKSGTGGTLYSEANFTQGNRSVLSGDTLNCTATQTVS